MGCVAQVAGASAIEGVNVVSSRALHTVFVVAIVGDVPATANYANDAIN